MNIKKTITLLLASLVLWGCTNPVIEVIDPEATPRAAAGIAEYPLSGGFGGNGGRVLDWKPEAGYKIRTIHVWSGSTINGIQIIYKNAYTGHVYTRGVMGSASGTLKSLTLSSNEYIDRVSGRYGSEVDRLRFETNTGRSITSGGYGGWPFEVDFGKRELLSIKGRYGSRIDKLYFYSANKAGATGVEKVGPFGGPGGHSFNWQKASGFINKMVIHQGSIVDGIEVSYERELANDQGYYKDYIIRDIGGNGGTAVTIDFYSSSYRKEFITGIAGSWTEHRGNKLVQGLTITIGKYNMMGKLLSTRVVRTGVGEYGTYPFHVDVPEGKIILGFFGGGGSYLDKLGFYIHDLLDADF